MGKVKKVDREANSLFRKRGAATLGLCLLAFVQLLTVSELDLPLSVAMSCFAVVIPMLTARLSFLDFEDKHEFRTACWYDDAFAVLPQIIAGIGITAAFWHFSWWIGAIFAVCAIASLCAALHYDITHDTLNARPKHAEPGAAADTGRK
jgi:hypothetical protein